MWLAPNNDPGFIHINDALSNEIEIVQNMPSILFLEELARCQMIVGNTSSCIREASFLAVPSVLIGDRQVGRVKAKNAISSGIYGLKQALNAAYDMVPEQSFLFGDGNSSRRIVSIMKGFLDGKEK